MIKLFIFLCALLLGKYETSAAGYMSMTSGGCGNREIIVERIWPAPDTELHNFYKGIKSIDISIVIFPEYSRVQRSNLYQVKISSMEKYLIDRLKAHLKENNVSIEVNSQQASIPDAQLELGLIAEDYDENLIAGVFETQIRLTNKNVRKLGMPRLFFISDNEEKTRDSTKKALNTIACDFVDSYLAAQK